MEAGLMVGGVQIIGILFGLLMLFFTFFYYKRKELERLELIFWIILWFLFVFVAAFPISLESLAETLSFQRSFDLLIVFGFLFLVALTFFSYMVVRKNEQKIERIVREVALRRK